MDGVAGASRWRAEVCGRSRRSRVSGLGHFNSRVPERGVSVSAFFQRCAPEATDEQPFVLVRVADALLLSCAPPPDTEITSLDVLQPPNSTCRFSCGDWSRDSLVLADTCGSLVLHRVASTSAERARTIPAPAVASTRGQKRPLGVSVESSGSLCAMSLSCGFVGAWDLAASSDEPVWSWYAPASSFSGVTTPAYGDVKFACWEKRHLAAGVGSSLTFFDTREKEPVATVPGAHEGEVSSIEWNPRRTEWLASGGRDDSLIKIWDRRHSAKPLVVLGEQGGRIGSLAWDPSHIELLLVSSSDSSICCYSLHPCAAPHQLLWRSCPGESDDADEAAMAAALAVKFVTRADSASAARRHAAKEGVSEKSAAVFGSCFAATDLGVRVVQMEDEFAEEIVSAYRSYAAQRVESAAQGAADDDATRAVARLVYTRDLEEARRVALDRAKWHDANNDPQSALAILDLCSPTEGSDKSKSFSESVVAGALLLQGDATVADESELASEVKEMGLLMEIKCVVKNGTGGSKLLGKRSAITDLLRNKKLGPDLTFQLTRELMSCDYLFAISNFAVDAALIFAANKAFASFVPVARLLLFPTVFDDEALLATTSSIQLSDIAAIKAAADDASEADTMTEDGTDSVCGDDSELTSTASSLDLPSASSPAVTMSPMHTRQASGSRGRAKELDTLLRKYEVVVEQLRFLGAFTELQLRRRDAQTVKGMCKLMKATNRPKPVVLSFSVQASWLHLLLQQGMFGRFFKYLTELKENELLREKGGVINTIWSSFLAMGCSRYSESLETHIAGPKATQDVSLDVLSQHVKAVLALLACPREGPVVGLLKSLPSVIVKLTMLVELGLKELVKNPDQRSEELSGKAQARSRADQLSSRVDLALSSTSDNSSYPRRELKGLLQMLQQYQKE